MKKEKKEDTFIKHPYYAGGNKAMNELIYSNLKYPKDAAKNKIEGLVIIKYDINHIGHVIDAKIVKGLGYGCDEESLRVVKLLTFEVPKNPRKLKVTFHKDIHIHFKVDKEVVPDKVNVPVQNTAINLSYTVVPSKQETPAEVVNDKQSQVFTYSIKLN